MTHYGIDVKDLDAHKLKSFVEQQRNNIYNNPVSLNPISMDAVFTNNEISFRHINCYGFDYDYTLAIYSDELHNLIYQMAIDNLITKYGYPKALLDYKYDAGFPIRGLHFDTEKGYLMKLDSFSHVQLGSVYRGLQKVVDRDVVKECGGTLISVDQINLGRKKSGSTIYQQMDSFSLPFLSLLSNVIEHFVSTNIPFDPGYIYHDVNKATQDIHTSGMMHQAIVDDLDRFLPKKAGLESYLNGLVDNNKLFIITNSSFKFVNRGLIHLLGPYWRDLFDVVVVNARKPKFFTDTDSAFRPFRAINAETGHHMWGQVQHFDKHAVYAEGNVKLFHQYTGYEGPSVIYFGDHVYSDLMDPVLRYGWRTGAIIPELEREIKICNSDIYIRDVNWLLFVEEMINTIQLSDERKNNNRALQNKLKEERKMIRDRLKSLFNPYFGSMFRTYHNATSFSRRMTRFADIYTSSLENLLHYSNDYHFFPRRNHLPHEHSYYPVLWNNDEN